jgi:hypothetical protein
MSQLALDFVQNINGKDKTDLCTLSFNYSEEVLLFMLSIHDDAFNRTVFVMQTLCLLT